MKNLALLMIATIVLFGCNNDPRLKMPQTGSFGVEFPADSTVTVEQVAKGLDTTNNIPVQVTGTVTQYCKGEGCWLTLKNPGGEDLFVEVKDKKFVLPHNLENKTAIAKGIARKDTVEGKVQHSVVAEGIIVK
jgi:hypothetical protein